MAWVADWDALYVQDETPSELVRKWLQQTDSLTKQAKILFQNVKVNVLNEAWLSPDQFVREINMHCDDFIGWYARTTIPCETYDIRKEQWQALKNKPLGSILFHDPVITRGSFEYACLMSEMPEYHWALTSKQYANPPMHLWARRSTFFIHDQDISYPLYLLEVFFPEIFCFHVTK